MDNAADRKAMILAAKIELDGAQAGFTRLGHILAAIQRLAVGTDAAVANLAAVGTAIADEFLNETQAAADQYGLLLDNLENPEKLHG